MMDTDTTSKSSCESKGLVFGIAKVGSYNSPMFKDEDIIAKAQSIRELLILCGSSISAEELCGGKCHEVNSICLPHTLQSSGSSDADLSIHGPDVNGNSYYNLVIVGKGLVGWSAVESTCICVPK